MDHAKNAPTEPTSTPPSESAELPARPAKFTTRSTRPVSAPRISTVLREFAAPALEILPMMPRPRSAAAPQDTETKEDSASSAAE